MMSTGPPPQDRSIKDYDNKSEEMLNGIKQQLLTHSL
jgi:hypothetical protein